MQPSLGEPETYYWSQEHWAQGGVGDYEEQVEDESAGAQGRAWSLQNLMPKPFDVSARLPRELQQGGMSWLSQQVPE